MLAHSFVLLLSLTEQHAVSPRASRARDPSIPPRPARGPASLGGAPPRRRGLGALLFSLPTTLLRTAFNLTVSAVSISFSLLNVLGSRLLPVNVMNTLRGMCATVCAHAKKHKSLLLCTRQGSAYSFVPSCLFSCTILHHLQNSIPRPHAPPSTTTPTTGLFAAIMMRNQEMDATTAATLFSDQFAQQHGPITPRWLSCSWVDATSRAHASYKFLFVYLHCPSHQDTSRFCRETLCHPDVVSYVNQTFLCWGGDVRMSDACRV